MTAPPCCQVIMYLSRIRSSRSSSPLIPQQSQSIQAGTDFLHLSMYYYIIATVNCQYQSKRRSVLLLSQSALTGGAKTNDYPHFAKMAVFSQKGRHAKRVSLFWRIVIGNSREGIPGPSRTRPMRDGSCLHRRRTPGPKCEAFFALSEAERIKLRRKNLFCKSLTMVLI